MVVQVKGPTGLLIGETAPIHCRSTDAPGQRKSYSSFV